MEQVWRPNFSKLFSFFLSWSLWLANSRELGQEVRFAAKRGRWVVRTEPQETTETPATGGRTTKKLPCMRASRSKQYLDLDPKTTENGGPKPHSGAGNYFAYLEGQGA